jgi:hypothetical protein
MLPPSGRHWLGTQERWRVPALHLRPALALVGALPVHLDSLSVLVRRLQPPAVAMLVHAELWWSLLRRCRRSHHLARSQPAFTAPGASLMGLRGKLPRALCWQLGEPASDEGSRQDVISAAVAGWPSPCCHCAISRSRTVGSAWGLRCLFAGTAASRGSVCVRSTAAVGNILGHGRARLGATACSHAPCSSSHAGLL